MEELLQHTVDNHQYKWKYPFFLLLYPLEALIDQSISYHLRAFFIKLGPECGGKSPHVQSTSQLFHNPAMMSEWFPLQGCLQCTAISECACAQETQPFNLSDQPHVLHHWGLRKREGGGSCQTGGSSMYVSWTVTHVARENLKYLSFGKKKWYLKAPH